MIDVLAGHDWYCAGCYVVGPDRPYCLTPTCPYFRGDAGLMQIVAEWKCRNRVEAARREAMKEGGE
jgi:hypothetical protein